MLTDLPDPTFLASDPQQRDGFPLWSDRLARGPWLVEVRFVGGGGNAGRPRRRAVLAAVEPRPPALAWARQVHSATVLPARPGACGAGDALLTRRPGLALSVVTADCVPLLLAAAEEGELALAAVHAGWRGIAAGIVGAAVGALGTDPAAVAAWIGPAIGPCCYEVGEEVARRVAAASAPEVVRPNVRPGRPNPHLDLPAAVRRQLAAAGVGEVRGLDLCTRCHPGELSSYRREGRGGGRNLAFIWAGRRELRE